MSKSWIGHTKPVRKQRAGHGAVRASTTTTEAAHQDDRVTAYRTYVYLNLWSDVDPTDTAGRIRAAMYDAGFFMVEESDKGYNQPAYDTATTQFTVQWTWCLQTEVTLGAP